MKRPRGRTIVALLVGVGILAVAFSFVEKLEANLHRQQRDAPERIIGTALGATVEPLDRTTARDLSIRPGEKGLVVTSLARNGPAARAGVRPGDVIERVGATRTASIEDAATALETARAPIRMTLNSRGHYAIVTLPISPTRDGRSLEQGDVQ